MYVHEIWVNFCFTAFCTSLSLTKMNQEKIRTYQASIWHSVGLPGYFIKLWHFYSLWDENCSRNPHLMINNNRVHVLGWSHALPVLKYRTHLYQHIFTISNTFWFTFFKQQHNVKCAKGLNVQNYFLNWPSSSVPWSGHHSSHLPTAHHLATIEAYILVFPSPAYFFPWNISTSLG